MLNDTADQRCTIQRPNGSFCDGESAAWAPFPICATHARRLYEVAHDLVTNADSRDAGRYVVTTEVVAGWRADEERLEREAVVYYVDVRGLVKIGYTTNLRARLHSYPPGSKLLAIEAGGPIVEHRRHREFAHLLDAGKEWFRPGEDLMAHVANLGWTG